MPFFSDKDLEYTYQDQEVHRAINRLIRDHSTNQTDIRDFAFASLDFARVDSILDLGCAFGFSILGLAGRIKPKTHILGLDLQAAYQQPFLAACKEIGAIGEFHLSDVAELASYPAASFDLVIASFSLYFFPAAIGDIANVLKEDGCFVAITHSEEMLREMIGHIPRVMRDLGIEVPELLRIQELLRTFSYENGGELLAPHFAEVERRLFENRLRFCTDDLSALAGYLDIKKHLFLKELYDQAPDSVGAALQTIMGTLADEVGSGKCFECNKDDGVFICRRPLAGVSPPARPLSPLYCSSCGQTLEERKIEGRVRKFCLACGSIAYENPLPVAAAMVVDDRRQVLLVRRANQPMRGMWCLPCGFAEVDEKIEEAAVRELLEETSLTGVNCRLLDVRTTRNYYYGNMVMVTYLIETVRGIPEAGDDAAEVRFFPLDDLPPLAFPSHSMAIEKYLKQS